jgi:hypothetical protein
MKNSWTRDELTEETEQLIRDYLANARRYLSDQAYWLMMARGALCLPGRLYGHESDEYRRLKTMIDEYE